MVYIEKEKKKSKENIKIMCWNGQGSHVEILFEMLTEVLREEKKEKDISRGGEYTSKDSQVEKNMSKSKNNEKKYKNEF